jgi:hypothetical protein
MSLETHLQNLHQQAKMAAFGWYVRKGIVPPLLSGILEVTSSLDAFCDANLKFNPNHAPAGGPGPGQFISAPGGGGATVEDGPAHHPHGDTTDDPADSHQRHLDVDGAVKELHRKVDKIAEEYPYGSGHCAQYVREALNTGGGLDIKPPPSSYAKDFGSSLEASGFEEKINVPQGQSGLPEGYKPLIGDVAVIQGTTKNPYGHMQMYDGSQWVSDFRQNGYWPGPQYRIQKPSSVVYRHRKIK